MTAKDIDKLVEALSQLGQPVSKRVVNFRNNRKERDFEVLDYTKLVVPQDCNIPLTMEQQVAKIMYASGQIDEVTYARMVGISYDDDDAAAADFSFEEYDEVTSAKQSALASYDDDETLLLKDKPRSAPDAKAKKDTKGADAPSNPQDSDSSTGSGVSPDSAGDNLED